MQRITKVLVADRTQAGVGMIEILIALLVLSIGFLGYAGLQLRALDSTNESYMRSQAMAIAEDTVERMMANVGARATYRNIVNWGAAPSALPTKCLSGDCTASEIAAWDIQRLSWYANDLLAQGVIRVEGCDGSTGECVLVAWNGVSLDDCQDGNKVVSGIDCVVLEVRI